MAFNFDNDPVFSGLSDTPAPAANPVTPITKNPEQPANEFSFENDPVFSGLDMAPVVTPVAQPGIQKPYVPDQQPTVRSEMHSYEPTILDRIMDFFPDNKARASNELAVRRMAEEKGVSVDQAYKSIGFGAQRPMLNPEGRAPVRSVVEGTKIFVKRAPTYPIDTANAVLRTIRGGDTTVNDSTLDEWVNWTTTERDPDYDTNYDAVYNAGSSLGFSIATMATAAATYAGVQAATANPVAATVAGMAASGATAFRASKDQFLSSAKEMLDKQSMEVYGRPLNQDEWDSALEEFNTEANKYGAWEAIPEAVSNIIFVKALSAPMKGMGKAGIATVKDKAARVVADYLKTQAAETGTETITAMGQSRAEANVGLRDESLSLPEAIREVLPSTVLLTTAMNAGGASARYAAGKFGKKPGADKTAGDAIDILGGVETADDVLGAEAMQPAGVQRALPAPVVVVDKAGVAGTQAQREKADAENAANREILGEGDPAAIARDQERTAQSGYAAREKIAQRLPENLPDPRLGRDQFRNKLEMLVTTDFIKGGGVSATIDPNYQRGESDGDLAQPMTGRTPSLNPEWAQALLQETGATTEEVGKAVKKAMAGERLGVRQARIVSGMLDYVSDKRNNPETLAYMKRERENAQHLRRVSRGEIPSQTEFDQLSDQYAGSRFDEREYPAHWDGESRSLYEIMNDAVAANPEETDRILTASAQNEWSIMTTVQMLQQRVLDGGRNAQQDASGSVEQGAVQPQEGIPAQAQAPVGTPVDVGAGQAAGINPAIQSAGVPAAGSVEPGQPAQIAPAFDLATDPVFAATAPDRRQQAKPVAAEHRQDKERRAVKRTDEMTLEEAREALRTSDKNVLRNERAYNEDERLEHQAFFDVDDFKNLNDKLTYAGGDLVIDEIGRIMAEEATDAVIPYHLHGDEFIVQSNDEQALTDYSNRVQSRLKSLPVSFKLPNGSLIEHVGIGVSYGIGSTKEQAESRLKADKKRRQQSGQRSGVRNGEPATEARGELGRALDENAEGNQDRAGRTDQSEKVAPAKKKNPAKSEDGAAVSEPKKNPAQKVEADPIQFALDNNISKDKYLSYLTGRLGKAEFAKQKADIEARWNETHKSESVVNNSFATQQQEAVEAIKSSDLTPIEKLTTIAAVNKGDIAPKDVQDVVSESKKQIEKPTENSPTQKEWSDAINLSMTEWNKSDRGQRSMIAARAGYGKAMFGKKTLAMIEWDDMDISTRRALAKKYLSKTNNGSEIPQKAELTGDEKPVKEQDDVSKRILEAEANGVILSDKDKAEIRDAFARSDELNKKGNRLSSADPMNKGNAFPMGVGFTKMTKRKERALDSSVRKAGEAVVFYNKANQAFEYAEKLLSGKGTEADIAKKKAAKDEAKRFLVTKLLNWKKGDKISSFTVERVNNDRDGYPATYTISGDGIVKGIHDKIDVAKSFFDGNKDALRALVDEIKAEQATPEAPQLTEAAKTGAQDVVGDITQEPAKDEQDLSIKKYDLPENTKFFYGKNGFAKGKIGASTDSVDTNWHDTVDAAAKELAQFLESARSGRENKAAVTAAQKSVANKLRDGENPDFSEWKKAFPQLKMGHTYLRQPDISPFLIENFGFKSNAIKTGLGAAAGVITTDTGTKYPIVYFNKLADVLGNNQNQSEQEVTAILDAANVTGKDRLDIMAKFRSGEYTLDDIKQAYPAVREKISKESIKKQPWEMTGEEWAIEREKVRPNVAQSNFTKASGSQATANIQRLEELLYGVSNDASEKMKQAIAGEIKLSPDELAVVDERLNTPIQHRDVIEKAIAEGKPVPADVLSEYPDLSDLSDLAAGADTNVATSDQTNEKIDDLGEAMYSKGQPSIDTHTTDTLKSAMDKVIKSFGYGVDKLLDTGKVKIVTGAEADKVIGNKMFSRAFHGSPFRFDKFTLDHIGKGEGAQAYGYGLYFAGNKDVAEYYRKGLSYREIVKEFRNELPDDADLDEALDAADTMTPARGRVIRALAADEWLGFDYPAQAITAAFKELENYDPSPELRGAVNAALGQLYEVTIPEDDTMLLWDKPLSEQSENVKASLRKKEAQEVLSYAGIGFKSLKEDGNNLYNKLSYYFDSNRQLNENGMPSTDDPQKLTSNFLNSIGITGIKYLDGTSRDKGEGSFNYVIFDDASIKIHDMLYSKSGNPLAFFNPADGITYFIADNINKNSTDAQIRGLLMHEISVHALNLNRDSKEFKSILNQLQNMRKLGNKKVQAAYQRAKDAGTREADMIHEELAYFIEANPDVSLTKRVINWFRQMIRKLFPGFKYSESELSQMARDALKVAPESLVGEQDSMDETAMQGQPVFSRDDNEVSQPETTLLEKLKDSQPLDAAFRLAFELPRIPKLTTAAHDWIVRKIKQDEFSDTGYMAWANPIIEHLRAGLVDRHGLSDEYIRRDEHRESDKRTIQRKGVDFINRLIERNMDVNEARVFKAMLEGEQITDSQWNDIGPEIRQDLDAMGAELVDLGWISADTYDKHRGTWLHRVYEKHEKEQGTLQGWVSKGMARRRAKMYGNQFRQRGMNIGVTMDTLLAATPQDWFGRKRNPAREDTHLKGEKFIVLDRIQAIGQGTATMPGMGIPSRKPKVLERVYWPAATPVPAKYGAWENRGTWEVTGFKQGKVTLWRDYTKAERESMGEILDARYVLGKTYMLLANDVANARFFDDVAKNPEWTWTGSEPPPADLTTTPQGAMSTYVGYEWVLVPETKLAGTGKYQWGPLAGKYIRAEIFRDLHELQRLRLPGVWKSLLTQWKVNKTAYSPVTHMNNVMSNFILMDLADVRMRDLTHAVQAMVTKSPEYRDAEAHGLFGSDMMSQEIRDRFMRPLLDTLQQEQADSMDMTVFSKAFQKAHAALNAATTGMRNIYTMEDEVFRMATYIRNLSRGMQPDDAARQARAQFLNYDIRAPWVNAARETVLPFISYTYRAVPILAEAIAHRPWKLAKYVSIFYGLNALAYMLAPSDDDEDKERRSLPEAQSGNTWLGMPRMLRMPYLDENENPVFLDVRRWIPAGDVYDMNQGNGALPVPAPLQFGGPLMLASELALNKTGFTGKEITNDLTDTGMEKAGKVAGYLWKAWMPNAPWIPGSWSADKLMRSAGGGRDMQGRDYSLGQAAASAIGIKLTPQDVDMGFAYYGMEFERVGRALEFEMMKLSGDYQRGLIDEDDYESEREDLEEKMRMLSERAKERFAGAEQE